MMNDNHIIKSGLRIPGWLVFHPAAWRAHVARIDPELPPDFALAGLAADKRRHPAVRGLRLMIFGVQPLWTGILVALMLWAGGLEIPQILLGTAYGAMACLTGGGIAAYTVSVAFALIAGGTGGLLAGLVFGAHEGAMREAGGVLAGIFAFSAAGSVTANLHAEFAAGALGRQIGSAVAGIAAGAIILIAGSLLGNAAAVALSIAPDFEPYAQAAGMAAVSGLYLGWRFKGWRWKLGTAFFLGIAATLMMFMVFGVIDEVQSAWMKGLLVGIAGGTVNGMLFAVLFALPYLVVQQLADVRAAVISGILSCGGVYAGLMAFTSHNNALLGWSLLVFALGFSQKLWRPVLLYPFFSAWNLLLYRMMQQQTGSSTGIFSKTPSKTPSAPPSEIPLSKGDLEKLFRRHSVFRDEHQRLPLRGLEDHLLLLCDNDAAAGQSAMEMLSAGPQGWAVRAAQTELDMRRLEQCNTPAEIAKVHNTLSSNDKLTETAKDGQYNFRQISRDVEAALLRQGGYHQRAALNAVIAYLNGILAVRPQKTQQKSFWKFSFFQRGGNSLRFHSIALKWRRVATEYAGDLQKNREIPDPYVVGAPLDEHHDVFIGRGEISRRIEHLLLARRCPPLLLYGQRRTGKTSLLYNLARMLPGSVTLLFVDCQGPVSLAQDHAGFFYNFVCAAVNAGQQQYPHLKIPLPAEENLRADPFARFGEWLDDVEQALGENLLVLALDEFVTLDEAFGEGRLQQSAILGMFRHIIQHRPRCRLLFSGTHAFAELQHWAGYLINVQTVHIGCLSENEARQLIGQPVEDFPLHYATQAMQRVLTLTGAHPALVQLLCAEIVQLKNTQTPDKRFSVLAADVEAAVPGAFEYGAFFFTDISRNQAGADGCRLLRHIAEHGEGISVPKSSLLLQFPDGLDAVLEHLLRHEVLEAGRDGYRFQVELVRRWFARLKLEIRNGD
ncbi:MAG: ATP-binding protein [Gammaproteobacteria bacterium]|nr:ATP-binding protein [Gammaproteobacteria bacterium]